MRNAKLTRVVMLGAALLMGAAYVSAQDWPQWRGPNRDNKAVGFNAPKTWPKELTKKWSAPVGGGDSSPVLVGDKLYVFARQGGDEVTWCLDAATGKEVWKDKYAAQAPTTPAAGIHAGPRSTPAVGDGKVCTLGVRGVVSCLDAGSGKVVWRKDTKAFPKFFTSSSPIIVDGMCIVFADGLTAFDLATGDSKWSWGGKGKAPYGSPILMTVDGVKQIVSPTTSSIVGISLADGKLLWEVSYSAKYMNDTPIVNGDTVIYSASGTGTIAFKVEKKGAGFTTKELWSVKQASNQYNTPLLKDGLLYGISTGKNFYCMKADTGTVAWTDKEKRGDCGAIVDAGSLLLALTNDNNLVAFEPSDKGFMQVASYMVAKSPVWAEPVVSGSRIFVKDQDAVTLWVIE